MAFTDKTLTCRDCGAAFTFTAGEQDFYAQKGFDNEPTRCPGCRSARKAERGGGGGGYGGGGGSYGGGGGGYGGQRREMHAAVCAQCGRATEVPFVPRGDRPIYCNDCFRDRAPQRSSSRY